MLKDLFLVRGEIFGLDVLKAAHRQSPGSGQWLCCSWPTQLNGRVFVDEVIVPHQLQDNYARLTAETVLVSTARYRGSAISEVPCSGRARPSRPDSPWRD